MKPLERNVGVLNCSPWQSCEAIPPSGIKRCQKLHAQKGSPSVSVCVRPFFWRLWSELHRSSSADCNQYDTLRCGVVCVSTVCPRCWSGVWNAKQTISSWESNTRSTRSLGLLICLPISWSACSTEQHKTTALANKSWALYYVLLLCAPQTACRRHSRDFCPSPITNLHRVSASHRPASRFIRSSGDSGDLRRIRGHQEQVLLGSYLRTVWNS